MFLSDEMKYYRQVKSYVEKLIFQCGFLICEFADPPSIRKTQSSEPPVGRLGTLQCEAAAVPTPEFEWYRDDKRYNLPHI